MKRGCDAQVTLSDSLIGSRTQATVNPCISTSPVSRIEPMSTPCSLAAATDALRRRLHRRSSSRRKSTRTLLAIISRSMSGRGYRPVKRRRASMIRAGTKANGLSAPCRVVTGRKSCEWNSSGRTCVPRAPVFRWVARLRPRRGRSSPICYFTPIGPYLVTPWLRPCGPRPRTNEHGTTSGVTSRSYSDICRSSVRPSAGSSWTIERCGGVQTRRL